MAIKAISQFDAAMPTDDDYILFEQNGEGKSAKFGDFSLTYEEIMASTNLTGKIASAGALKKASIREKLYMNMTVDSAGNIYFEDISTANNIILSVVSPQTYTFGLALYSDGSRYYAKVFRADGTLAIGETVAHAYVRYWSYGL